MLMDDPNVMDHARSLHALKNLYMYLHEYHEYTNYDYMFCIFLF